MSSLSRLIFTRSLSHWAAVSGFPESSLDLALSPKVFHMEDCRNFTATAQAWSRGLNQNHPDWCLRKALITKKRNHCTGPATAGAECAEPELGVPVRSSRPASPAPRHRRARSGQAVVWMETPVPSPCGSCLVAGHAARLWPPHPPRQCPPARAPSEALPRTFSQETANKAQRLRRGPHTRKMTNTFLF